MGRLVALLAAACALAVSAAGGFSPVASADTAPTISAITPNSVPSACPPLGDSCDGVTLDVTGDGFSGSSTIQWRGADYPVNWDGDSTHVSVTIPYSALSISEAFLTVDVTLTTGSVASNPRPVTIVGPGVTGAQSAVVGAGGSATVSTDRLSATYTRAAAGFGTVTAASYRFAPGGPPISPNPFIPSGPPISPVAFVDLQLRSAGVGDTLVGTFLPPNPIVPPNPMQPSPPPILPPNPVRLAYWSGTSWAPVLGSGGIAPDFGFDWATTSATAAAVTFDLTSAPKVTQLGGTVFALVAAHAFMGFDDPVENSVANAAKAGRAVPLKWRVLDLGGNPVADLSAGVVKATSVRIDCTGLSAEEEAVDAYAAGASGLQNLGGGSYQLNWRTEPSWKGTCRRLQLDLGDRNPDGTPVYRTADFVFTR
jgi:hypothetical protein